MTRIRSTDASGIDDRRGGGGGGGGGGLGGVLGGVLGGAGMKAGGGLIGVLVLVAALVLPKLMGGGAGGADPAIGLGDRSSNAQAADAADGTCSSELEQIVCGGANDVQAYWTAALPQALGEPYRAGQTVFFTGQVSTGCGQASSQTGPFYCPADERVYIDLAFMQQLEDELIGGTSDLAEQYIVAHEFGHHVQNVRGTSGQVHAREQSDPANAHLYSVGLELQADCYAGAWIQSVIARGLLDDSAEVDEAFDAANGVGDDYIQSRGGGGVDPDSFTHGTSAQRKKWLNVGITTGDPRQCEGTFAEVGVTL